MYPNRTRVRFAPSPTGFLHIGGLRTALYNELLARHAGGDFILRIEDTDQKRFVEGGIESLCRSLERSGVIPNEGVWLDADGKIFERGDHGPYIQTARKDRHLAYAKQLIEMDKAYYCFCTEERLAELRAQQEASHQPTMYDRHCRGLSAEDVAARLASGAMHVIRLKIPEQGSVAFTDMIRGEVTIDWIQVDDQVIMKSDGLPTYHLAATCDDHDMEITHVIRGEEWVSSTPKHVFIYEAFGWDAPLFAHLPLLLNADRSKLSKRQGDVAVEDYLEKGYLPEALVNFVALLGWNPKADQEIYSKEELITHFDLSHVNKSGAVVNFEKLDWMNAQYIKMMPEERYLEIASSLIDSMRHGETSPSCVMSSDPASRERRGTRHLRGEISHCVRNDTGIGSQNDTGGACRNDRMGRILLLIRDRVVRLTDIPDLIAPFLAEHLDYSGVSLTWKTQSKEDARIRLEAMKTLIAGLSEEDCLNRELVEVHIKELIAKNGWGNGDTLWPLRVALSGQEKSPGPFDLIAAFGRERSLQRIEDAILT